MPTLIIATTSALLLAALVTEVTSRFWSNNYIALLVITFIALLINGLFNARLKQNTTPANQAKQNNRQRGEKSSAQSTGQSTGLSTGLSAGQGQRKKTNRGSRDNSGRNQNSSRAEAPRREKPARDKPAEEENAPRGPLENGSVKWFNRSKGYGFIIRENGDEIFVHQRSIITQGDRNQRPVLHDGQKVSFVVAHLEKGAQAEQVSGLD